MTSRCIKPVFSYLVKFTLFKPERLKIVGKFPEIRKFCAFSPRNRVRNFRPQVSGADDRLVKIWDYQTKTCVQTLEGHAQNLSCVSFHPEFPLIITGSEDR